MKEIFIFAILLLLSLSLSAQPIDGQQKHVYIKTDIDKNFIGTWELNDPGTISFKLHLSLRRNFHIKEANVNIDVLQGQFDYTKEGKSVFRDVGTHKFKISHGMPPFGESKVVNAVFFDGEVPGALRLELMENGNLKWKLVTRVSITEKGNASLVPRSMVLTKVKK